MKIIVSLNLCFLILASMGCESDDVATTGASFVQSDLLAPDPITTAVMKGVPPKIDSSSFNMFIRLQWKNPSQAKNVSVVIESKLSTESSFHALATLASDISTYDMDLGIVESDATYVFRIKSIEGKQESKYSDEISVPVSMDVLPVPANFAMTFDGLSMSYSWIYGTYSANQHTGFKISYSVVWPGAPASGILTIADPSARTYSNNPCQSISNPMGYAMSLQVQIQAVGSADVASSAWSATISMPCYF